MVSPLGTIGIWDVASASASCQVGCWPITPAALMDSPSPTGFRSNSAVSLGRYPHRHEKDGAPSFGVGGEERGHVVVVESEAAGPEPEGVTAEVELPSNDPGLQLSGAIAAVAKPLKDRPEVRQEEDVHTRVGRQRLFEAEIASLGPKVSFFQQLERGLIPSKHVGTGGKVVHGMDDEVEVVERRADRLEEISRESAGGSVEYCGELGKRDRLPGEPSS